MVSSDHQHCVLPTWRRLQLVKNSLDGGINGTYLIQERLVLVSNAVIRIRINRGDCGRQWRHAFIWSHSPRRMRHECVHNRNTCILALRELVNCLQHCIWLRERTLRVLLFEFIGHSSEATPSTFDRRYSFPQSGRKNALTVYITCVPKEAFQSRNIERSLRFACARAHLCWTQAGHWLNACHFSLSGKECENVLRIRRQERCCGFRRHMR